MNPVSAWTATAQSNIAEAASLASLELSGFLLSVHNSHDSIWIKATWPNGGSAGFRAAFAFGDTFGEAKIAKHENTVTISFSSRLGDYKVRLEIMESGQFVFHYTTVFTPSRPLFLDFSPRDIIPLTRKGDVANALGTVHVQQVGTRSGLLFLSFTGPKTGSIFYFQNLSALSAYCDATETSAGDTVGGSWPEVGFKLPASTQKPLPGEQEFTISDAFVLLSPEIPDTEPDITKQFLDYFAKIYLLIPKPPTKYNDWPTLAEKGLEDLRNNKGCWSYAGGHSYLNAYVSDYDTPAESMVQLAVLVPLTEYFGWGGNSDPILEELRSGLAAFYDEKCKTMVRWLPSEVDKLDQSEEQKKEYVMDSWYLHHPLMNLLRLAKQGDELARQLAFNSLDFAIKVAHTFKYNWPVFYKMDTLEVIKPETVEGAGGEHDVPGAYAQLMLEAYEQTGEARYLNEAKKAARMLEGKGFNIFYQANNTTFSAVAMLKLYKETSEEKYLDLSYSCLAGLLKNVQLWESDYGYAKAYPRFFAIYPLNDAPYTAPYEELEVFASLHTYLNEAIGMEILPSIRLLIAEFMRYFVYRMPYYYPTLLPNEMISVEVKTGEINPNLWIPLEDLRDGWEKSGQVGQEVYGAAGAGFGIVPRQYFKIPAKDLLLFCDYPLHDFRLHKDGSVTFNIGGDDRLECRIRVLGSQIKERKIELSNRENKVGTIDADKITQHYIEYGVNGDNRFRLDVK